MTGTDCVVDMSWGRTLKVALMATLCGTFASVAAHAEAYGFDGFGGRLGRPGVTDSLYAWNKGTSAGTVTWYLNRDELTLADADAPHFASMEALIQGTLDEWSTSVDLRSSKAASLASADVVIEFEKKFDVTGQNVPEDGGSGAAAQHGNTAGNTLLNAEIGLWPSAHWASDLGDFAWTILHEWGHVLGLADLYKTEHGDGEYEGEDFVDHGRPSIDPLDTRGKLDNVMQTPGVMHLDNDEIAAAQWLWGALGIDSIAAGALKPRAAGSNATRTDDHHGPNTWHYRGTSSLVRSDQPTVVTLYASGVTAARDVGPGDWVANILPDRVAFTSGLGYAGNFEFEIDSTLREGYIRAAISDNTPTSFTDMPSANGRQLAPMVFGPVPVSEPASTLLAGAAMLVLLVFTMKARARAWRSDAVTGMRRHAKGTGAVCRLAQQSTPEALLRGDDAAMYRYKAHIKGSVCTKEAVSPVT